MTALSGLLGKHFGPNLTLHDSRETICGIVDFMSKERLLLAAPKFIERLF